MYSKNISIQEGNIMAKKEIVRPLREVKAIKTPKKLNPKVNHRPMRKVKKVTDKPEDPKIIPRARRAVKTREDPVLEEWKIELLKEEDKLSRVRCYREATEVRLDFLISEHDGVIKQLKDDIKDKKAIEVKYEAKIAILVKNVESPPAKKSTEEIYNEKTGKNAVYRGKITKKFLAWKEQYEASGE